MLLNLTDKYQDLIAAGKTEQEAYRIVIDSIGDISSLIGQAGGHGGAQAQANVYQAPQKEKKHGHGWIVAIVAILAVLAIVITAFALVFDFREERMNLSRPTEQIVGQDNPAAMITPVPQDAAAAPVQGGQKDNGNGNGNGSGGGQAANAPAQVQQQGDAYTVSAADVKELEINWVSGNVSFVSGSGSDISFQEKANVSLTNAQRLRCTLQNGKLKISYCQQAHNVWQWLDLASFNLPSKDLVVTIPADYIGVIRELEVQAVSADVQMHGVYADDTEIESVSGDIDASGIMGKKFSVATTSGEARVENIAVTKLDLESVSGELRCTGATANQIEAETVSGNVTLSLDALPSELEADSVSGDITVLLYEKDANFTISLETVSGDVICQFPTVVQNGRYIAGDGLAKFKLGSVSGDFIINKR